MKLFNKIQSYRPVLWINGKREAGPGAEQAGNNIVDLEEAEQRFKRFAPFIKAAFPETSEDNGIIESPLYRIDRMALYLAGLVKESIGPSGWSILDTHNASAPLNLYLKGDHELPVSGSIKARGGFYAVLKHAEELALENGFIKAADAGGGLRGRRMSRDTGKDDYSIFAGPMARELFSRHKIVVGSTGNLGLSIGIMGAGLGFKVDVHMSADAKEWKKNLLRSRGVTIIEYTVDYSAAVAEGRKQAEADPASHFIDDENSRDLFLGYSVAALRLKEQLAAAGVEVSEDRPLFVYLPCGVGGGPGGIAWGLHILYGKNVYPFFAEPTRAPCMLLGLVTGKHDGISVFDIGLDCRTAADGLAVGRPSGFVGKLIEPFLAGAYTVEDEMMFRLLAELYDTEGIEIEPSAAPGLIGPVMFQQTSTGRLFLEKNGLEDRFSKGTHIVWSTGGGMVPDGEMKKYIAKGRENVHFPLRV